MRIPSINMNKEYSPAPKDIIKVGELTDDRSSRYQLDLTDDRERNAFIKKCEKIVRNSYEYKEFVEFLKSYMDMRECAYFANVNNYDSRNIKIEIHHAPFTLYDIVDTVLRKRATEGQSISLLKVCDEVMGLHYMGYVGLIPLSATVHSLVHSGSISIPLRNVFGNFHVFYTQYQNYMNPELKDTFQEVLKNDANVSLTPPDILKIKYLEVEMSGVEKVDKLYIEPKETELDKFNKMTPEEKTRYVRMKLGIED